MDPSIAPASRAAVVTPNDSAIVGARAYAMLQQGMDTSPIQSPWQGAARLAQALMGGLTIRQQDQERQAAAAKGPAAPTAVPPTSPARSPGFLPSLFGGPRSAP